MLSNKILCCLDKIHFPFTIEFVTSFNLFPILPCHDFIPESGSSSKLFCYVNIYTQFGLYYGYIAIVSKHFSSISFQENVLVMCCASCLTTPQLAKQETTAHIVLCFFRQLLLPDVHTSGLFNPKYCETSKLCFNLTTAVCVKLNEQRLKWPFRN